MNAPGCLRLYFVTDRVLCGSRGVIETTRAAVRGGATAVQLRDPQATTRALYEEALALREALQGTGVPLLVNDRLDVALAAGVEGVHLGQSDLPAAEARRLAGPNLVIGWSVTTVSEAEEAATWPHGVVDYLGAGPVYATTTKLDAAPPLGLDGLRQAVAAARAAALPTVAIGGIGLGQAAGCVEAGADGIAVVSAICSAHDPEDVTRRLRKEVDR